MERGKEFRNEKSNSALWGNGGKTAGPALGKDRPGCLGGRRLQSKGRSLV